MNINLFKLSSSGEMNCRWVDIRLARFWPSFYFKSVFIKISSRFPKYVNQLSPSPKKTY